MWTVAKFKKKELNIFKEEMIEKFGQEIIFYCPKIEHKKHFKNNIKKFERLLLENYIFCYHTKFTTFSTINELRFLKGLEYFLSGYKQSQNEIIKFINNCKSFENKEGYLTSAFFKNILSKKAQFISGPFTSMMFEIIERQKNKLKILLGNIVTTISDKNNYLYRPI